MCHFLKTAYERFNITHGITGVIGMKVKKFSKMCRRILSTVKFKFGFYSSTTDPPCKTSDENIRLLMRDAENLPAEKIRVRQCPAVSDILFLHYMTISTQENAVLMYEKYEKYHNIVPIALARGIQIIEV